MIAHINSITGGRQSVEEHCKDTAIIAEAYGKKIALKNTSYLLGVMHDLGKMTLIFKEYIEASVFNEGTVRRGEINHSSAGAVFLHERYYHGDEMHLLTAQLLTVAIYSHHGLYDILSPEGKDILNMKMQKKDEIHYNEATNNYLELCLPLVELDKMFEKAVSEITNIYKIIDKMTENYTDEKEIYYAKQFYFSCLERILLSCLIDADRIDTATFCGDRNNCPEKTSKRNLWDELHNILEEELQSFIQLDKISLLRSEMSEVCLDFAKNKCAIYQLMVPTGGGKTLSSLRYCIAHAKQFNKDRILYVAPYMSILDQNADVIKRILHRDDIILEHHSNVIHESEDNIKEWKHLTENWDSPIVLTTMVQMLNTLFDGRTQCIRRMHNLSNSVIIFDEIQSLPAKCIHIFNMTMNFLCYVCGATVILCSATQPLLDRKVQYKILLGEPACIIQNIDELYRKFKRVEIINSIIPGGYDAQKLSQMVMKIMANSNNVLTIMNTKKAASKLFIAINETMNLLQDVDKIKIVLLTTHMCPKHRLNIINEVKNKLGKERIICISTSLIEAGVDISFDYVIRSLAGLDNIAQAAGRCNRNGRVEKGIVYIINSKDEDLSKLPEIQKAQIATNPILNKYDSDPEFFSRDLLSPFALEKFYEKYFFEIQKEMDYKIKNKNTNLFDMLSINETGMSAYYTNTHEYPKMILNQAFKTAGEEFEVIVNQTMGVIVPYNAEAKELIAILNGKSAMDEVKRALKNVQRYTINLFQYEFDQLSNIGGIYLLSNIGVCVLVDGFYSEDIGVTTEANMDFLTV